MKYVVLNGTSYSAKTAPDMMKRLEALRKSGERCRFHWGDTKTGQDWGDVHNVRGRIGRSMGPVKIPLLIYNRRSLGGGALLDSCIVKITATRGGRVIYQHPNYREAKP